MSEQTTAANLDEAIETQMKQSESACTRKTDGIDYKQSRSSVLSAWALIPSLEIMLPLVVTTYSLSRTEILLQHGTDGSHIAISFNYYNNRRFSMISHAPSGLSEGSGNFQTVRFFVNHFILTAQSDTADIHAS